MDFDYKQAALDLAAAVNSLSHRLYKLDYLDVVDKDEAIRLIKIEQNRVNVLKKKIWNMRAAESVLDQIDDDIYEEIVEWLYENGISTFDSSTRSDNVFLAVENGWEMFPEPSDSFGEPPMTMSEMLENSRKEKREAWVE